MTISARRPRYSLRLKASRDWPLVAAAISAFLSFVMLFPPWLTGGGESEDAFGEGLQSAGPALIIVMALATIVFLATAVATTNRRHVRAAFTSSSILLAIYVVKVADVSDLADLYNRLAASFTGASVGTGAGLWLGFVFALLTELLVLAALAFQWGMGEALMYPSFSAPREPRYDARLDADPPDYPPRPDDPPDSPRERPND
uniref:Integral membrane protein n=1 Tax=Streptomyces sp. NBC_00093 TaxID=2975649 RepID=A0AAU2ABR5_9ACTN